MVNHELRRLNNGVINVRPFPLSVSISGSSRQILTPNKRLTARDSHGSAFTFTFTLAGTELFEQVSGSRTVSWQQPQTAIQKPKTSSRSIRTRTINGATSAPDNTPTGELSTESSSVGPARATLRTAKTSTRTFGVFSTRRRERRFRASGSRSSWPTARPSSGSQKSRGAIPSSGSDSRGLLEQPHTNIETEPTMSKQRTSRSRLLSDDSPRFKTARPESVEQKLGNQPLGGRDWNTLSFTVTGVKANAPVSPCSAIGSARDSRWSHRSPPYTQQCQQAQG